jgi:3-oxoacyl-[acyl-carrier-protein] synthase II
MEKYVITGIGAINGLGLNVDQSWKNLLECKSAVTKLSWPSDDSTKFPNSYSIIKTLVAAVGPNLTSDVDHPEYFDYGWKHWDKNTRACLMSVDEAIRDSQLKSTNVGVVVSTFGSGTSTRLELFSAMNNGIKKVSPRKALNIGLDFPAAQIANIYKVTGPNTAMDSACTTGLTSIEHAINTLKANPELDAMIVGGSDYMAEPIYLYWFQSLGALSPSDNAQASCPWDQKRNGFVMGEGAATVIIEPLSKAVARNTKIYGEILSTSFVTIFDSDTSPDPLGIGARKCVEQALNRADISADQIDYINAHATSTQIGDQIEFNAMLDLFPNRTIVSNKGALGHTMSTSGIIETIYSLLVMRDQYTPGNLNLTDPLGSGMILPKTSQKISVNHIIKNSFGFGGRNASMVLKKYD